jgi:D-alanyl-D-alanine carboxypeptidase
MRHLCLRLGYRICISLAFATLCVLSGIAQDVNTNAALKSADDYIASQVANGSFRGAVLVGMNGKIAFEKGYGLANEEWGIPNGPSTEYRIFSMTKQFTGACILLLEERGLLGVQDPVSKYVSDLPDSWQPITIHQLLTHTSGIPNYPDMTPRAKELARVGATPREILAIAATKPLEFNPGTKLNYTNTGYILLGMIIEKVSGQSYADFLRKNIFAPLSMEHSGYDDQSLILKNRASGYSVRDGHTVNADFGDMSWPFSAGGIYSTVEDIFRWNEALTLAGRLLTAHSLKQMYAVYPETTAYGQNYGYGVVIAHRFGKLLYYHGGGWNGFESVVQRYPAEHVCIVVLSNTQNATPWDIGDHIASALFGQPPPAPK